MSEDICVVGVDGDYGTIEFYDGVKGHNKVIEVIILPHKKYCVWNGRIKRW
ncbi:MAG: hypothetical protein ACK4F9_00755 [Brevinematia bacterium]